MLTYAGECNYLFRIVPDTYDLYEVPASEWQTKDMLAWQVYADVC